MTRGFPEPGGRHGDDGLKVGRQGLQPVLDFMHSAVQQETPFFVWYASVLLDLSVVYQHIVLPEELTVTLPPMTENWKDFVANDNMGRRWRERTRLIQKAHK